MADAEQGRDAGVARSRIKTYDKHRLETLYASPW